MNSQTRLHTMQYSDLPPHGGYFHLVPVIWMEWKEPIREVEINIDEW